MDPALVLVWLTWGAAIGWSIRTVLSNASDSRLLSRSTTIETRLSVVETRLTTLEDEVNGLRRRAHELANHVHGVMMRLGIVKGPSDTVDNR